MADQWTKHADGFVCGDIGVFPAIPDAWAVWENVAGEWQEVEPFLAARRQVHTRGPNGGPPYQFSERTREETIEEAKRLALEWRQARQGKLSMISK